MRANDTKLLAVAGLTLLVGLVGATGFRYGDSVKALTPADADGEPTTDPSEIAAAPPGVEPPDSGAAARAGCGTGGEDDAESLPHGCDPGEASESAGSPGIPQGAGEYRAPRVTVDGSPRVYPLTRNVWVKRKPSSAGSWIGFLWWGNSVRLREAEGRKGPGCDGRWYAVEPRGFVCVDDRRATLDPDHPVVQGVTPYSPNLSSAWPHRYGESIDARVYRSLPSVERQRAHEWYHHLHGKRLARARAGEVLEELAGIDLTPAPAVDWPLPSLPRTLQPPRTRLKRRSTVAWTRQTLHGDRSFLLNADLKWVPKDRVIPYPTVTFRGVRLGREAKLPLAFFRKKDRPARRRLETGEFEESGESFARLSWVELTGREARSHGQRYLETRRPGLWVRDKDAVLPRLRKATPWGTALDAATDPKAPRGRQTWIEASIMGGWLLAYEGQTPVFATLLSAGRGGPPQGDKEPIETASTPVGRFKITGKFATATMIGPTDLVHSDVPWAQNFSGPHALHAAYWHNQWGELKSGGCLNVSPLDGEWLFKHFTEPELPEGWHGVRWLPKVERATTLIVRRR